MIYINKYIIKHSTTFEKELEEIYKYVAFILNKPNKAAYLYTKIKNSINLLQYYPERFPKIYTHKNISKNIRKMQVNKYVILYEVNVVLRTSFYLTYFS